MTCRHSETRGAVDDAVIGIGECQRLTDRLRWRVFSASGDAEGALRELGEHEAGFGHWLRASKGKIRTSGRCEHALLCRLIAETDPDIIRLRHPFEFGDPAADDHSARNLHELCLARNRLARGMGYGSYPDMMLESQELKPPNGYHGLADLLPFPDGIPRSDASCIEDYWTQAGSLLCGHDEVWPSDADCTEFAGRFIDAYLGPGARERIRIVCRDQPYTSGICVDLTRADTGPEAGILFRADGLRSFFVAAHEVGHAGLILGRSSEGLPVPPWFDETHAYAAQNRHALIIDLLAEGYGRTRVERWVRGHQRFASMDLARIRGSVVAETGLWLCVEEPSLDHKAWPHAVSKLTDRAYRDHLGIGYANPLGWVVDSFRSVDPMTVHSYGLAETLWPRWMRLSAEVRHDFDRCGRLLLECLCNGS